MTHIWVGIPPWGFSKGLNSPYPPPTRPVFELHLWDSESTILILRKEFPSDFLFFSSSLLFALTALLASVSLITMAASFSWTLTLWLKVVYKKHSLLFWRRWRWGKCRRCSCVLRWESTLQGRYKQETGSFDNVDMMLIVQTKICRTSQIGNTCMGM